MSADEQDLILLDALKAGNDLAFAQFYKKYRRYLMVVAVSLLEDEMDAQDLVQEFFIDFWEKQLFNKIDPGYSKGGGVLIKSYIHRIVYNRCMDKISLRKNKQKRIDTMPLPDIICPPEIRMEIRERQQHLNTALLSAIGKVPPLSAKVFELAYLHNKSRLQIAAEMSISPNTVKNQLVRAVRILRIQLKKI
jgi:RNA polymerase sigma-70 factor (ECF subfamily)